MRVVKPTSANSSPRASIMARRMTLLNEARIQQQILDQALLSTSFPDPTYDQYIEPVKRATRPMSWHPGTQLQQPAMQAQLPTTSFAVPPNMSYDISSFSPYPNYSPVPTVYSCQASPSAAFSPLVLPFAAYPAQQYPSAETWNLQSQAAPSLATPSPTYTQTTAEAFTSMSAETISSGATQSIDWDTFAANGFSDTTPPTPATYPSVQQAEPTVTSEESIPYQPLEEEEEEGEILIGMGLYDAPEKDVEDPNLSNYRTTTNHLLGAAHVTTEDNSLGWKLTEAWEPPASDDEEDDEEENDESEKEQK